MKGRAAAIVVVLLSASVPLVLALDADVFGAVLNPLVRASTASPAPPTVRIASPSPGEGVAPQVTLRGEARAESGTITDIQVRVDGGPWESAQGAAVGAPIATFASPLRLEPGIRLVEMRAATDFAYSPVTRVQVHVGTPAPPTVRILAPADGAGLVAGVVSVTGTVSSDGPVRVFVNDSRNEVEARVVPDRVAATWRAEVPLEPGVHTLRVHAVGGATSLPQSVTVALGAEMPPPMLRVARPEAGATFGSAGDAACPASCILFSGAVLGAPAADILVSLDGSPAQTLGLDAPLLLTQEVGAAWSWALGTSRLFSGEHVATFTPVGLDGTPGAPRDVVFHARTSRALHIDGDEVPRPTGTALAFALAGEDVAAARWLLDGQPVGNGTAVDLALATPGPHQLTAEAEDARGRVAHLHLPLYALNRPPSVLLLAEPRSASRDVLLTAQADDADGEVVRYRWSFGDGTGAETTGPAIVHAYARAGVYRANLTVVDDVGAESPVATILVPVANARPLADFSWSPARPSRLDVVGFQATGFDPDGGPLSFLWEFGDGATSRDWAPSHQFVERGAHVVRLRVTDAAGAATLVEKRVDVANLPAEVDFSWSPELPRAGEEVRFVSLAEKRDGALASWSWDFGHDCAAACNATDAPIAEGSAALHRFPAPGEYTVSLRVVDDWGDEVVVRTQVHVADALPQVAHVVLDPPSPVAMAPVAFRALTLNGTEPARLLWEFGDNATSDDMSPAHTYARSGLYHASVSVFDAAGAASVRPFQVLVNNSIPLVHLGLAGDRYAGLPTVLVANASDADGRIVRYRFDAQGDGVADCDGPTPRCRVVYPEIGTLEASVVAYDDEAAQVEATLRVDLLPPPPLLAPPRVLVDAPARDEILRGEILLHGTANGVRPVTFVEAQLRRGGYAYSDGPEGWTRAHGNATWRLLLDTRGLPDGAYSLVVRAHDEGGGVGQVSVPVRLANGITASEVRVVPANPPGEPLVDDYVLHGSAHHPAGISAVRWRLDDGPWQGAEGIPLAWRLVIPAASLAPGEHAIVVEAHRDVSERGEIRIPFLVAGAPPVLAVDRAPPATAYGVLTAAGRVQGDAQVFWRLDHGLWRPLPAGPSWSLDIQTDDLPGGPHRISFKAVSMDGRAESPAFAYDVRIVHPAAHYLRDTLPPDAGDDAATLPVGEGRAETPLGGGPLAVVAVLAALTFGRLRRRL